MYLFLSLFLSCTSSIEEFPTKKQIVDSEKHEDATSPPPLYQLLYDSHPQPTQEQQRVRVFLWLQTLELTATQIRRLEILRQDVVSRQKNIEELEKKILQDFIDKEQPIYNQFWDALQNGRNIEDLTEEITQLQTIRDQNQQSTQNDLLTLRLQSIREIFEKTSAFVRTMTPKQEKKIVESLFFLRHKLDPIGNPQDFSALVGNTYEPGQYAVLTRGTGKLAQQSLHFGGLWSDGAESAGQKLHEARREVLLYFVLLEPATSEALRLSMQRTR
jgi:hypothetical protein